MADAARTVEHAGLGRRRGEQGRELGGLDGAEDAHGRQDPDRALTGDATRHTGPARSLGYRWFTDPASRALYEPADHEFLGRMFASGLREALTRRGPGSRAARYCELLLACSEEFRRVWDAQEVGIRPKEVKRYVHPSIGALELHCQTLLDPDQHHFLLVYTATPGTESYEKLQLLSVLGADAPTG
ncbi:hypothetical protein [Lentzea albidocapillata]|uniref:MmyB-like transcription regulator ligand binding domain-containing protein n=1 Tax=Lentzea albidocapillata TaxID=40571 RepID=A0A1W2CVD0_9PSEU|nr:hypothetical protein [Lentzea albidocapillata]SMC89181.1 hypothetical protein SAMN05660733_02406 [Lentzea albidocapillata]